METEMDISPNRFLVEGCDSDVTLLQVEDRKQFILLVGENHTFVGNSDKFLKALADSTNCPIDVLIEKPYDTYWRVKIVDTGSNTVRLYLPPYDICTDPDEIPKENEVHLPRFRKYKTICLDPFKGKIKFWGTDIRRTSLFNLILRLTGIIPDYFSTHFPQDPKRALEQTIQTDASFRKWLNNLKKLNKAFFDFQMYNFSSEYFDKQIKDCLIKLYKETPDFLKQLAFRMAPTKKYTVEEEIEEIFKTSDKSHLDLAKRVWRLSGGNSQTVKNVQSFFSQKIDSNVLYLLFCSHFIDLETCLRIYNIVQKQKEGILVFFAGSEHTKVIREFLTQTNAKPTIKIIHNFPCPDLIRRSQVRIPNFVCENKLSRMKQYEKTK